MCTGSSAIEIRLRRGNARLNQQELGQPVGKRANTPTMGKSRLRLRIGAEVRQNIHGCFLRSNAQSSQPGVFVNSMGAQSIDIFEAGLRQTLAHLVHVEPKLALGKPRALVGLVGLARFGGAAVVGSEHGSVQ